MLKIIGRGATKPRFCPRLVPGCMMPLSPTRDLFESMLGFQLWIQVPPPGCVRGSPLYDAWTPDNGIGSDRLSMLDAFIQMRSCAQDGPMRPSKPHNIAIKMHCCPVFLKALTPAYCVPSSTDGLELHKSTASAKHLEALS